MAKEQVPPAAPLEGLRAVLGLDTDGAPGGYAWEAAFTEAQKRALAGDPAQPGRAGG